MKTAIYVEDGIIQVVVTPETAFEKQCLSMFKDREISAKMFVGSFYDCRGGWIRQSEYYPMVGLAPNKGNDSSLILAIKEKLPEPA